MSLAWLRLYVIIDPDRCRLDPLSVADAVLAEGASALQLRVEGWTDRRILALGQQLRDRTRHQGVPLIVNDRVDLALAIGADGVHLGVDDLPVAAARRIAGPDLIIGYSPDSDADAAEARALGADYLGIGPVFGTASKADAGPQIGLEVLRQRIEVSGLPAVGIGGIDPLNAHAVIDAGAAGVAVMSAVIGSPDPGSATRDLLRAIDPDRDR